MRPELRATRVPVAVGAVQMSGCDQRLNEEAIDCLVGGVLERECGEVDLLVPMFEELEVGAQGFSRPRVNRDVGFAGPLRQSVVEFPWRHC